MIVVIGAVRMREAEGRAEAVGLAASIAGAAAGAGSRVEFVGRVGDDPAGDALVLALARAGIGHVAVIRDAAHRTTVLAGTEDLDGATDVDATDDESIDADAEGTADSATPTPTPVELEGADAELALRYLPDIRAIVAVHAPADVVAKAVAAAAWASAPLVLVVPPGSDQPDPEAELPDTATTVALADDEGSLGGAALGRFAAALDQGTDAHAAWDAMLDAVRAAG